MTSLAPATRGGSVPAGPLPGSPIQGFPLRLPVQAGSERKKFDVRQLWAILLHRAPLALGVAAGTFLFVMLLVMQSKPIYQATAAVIVEPRENKVVNDDSTTGYLPGDT